MSLLAPTLQAFFTDRLITQRDVSPRTVAAYRDTFRLLLAFVEQQTGKQPYQLDLADLDAPLIGAFLTHLEQDRHNTPRTRNARLAAIHSFYRYAALRHPEHLATIARIMAIPTKRHQRNDLTYLTKPEIDALLQTPDRTTWLGRRDHTLLLTMITTGVRVSELDRHQHQRRDPRDRRAPPQSPRQRPQEPHHAAESRDHHRTPCMATRTRWRVPRAAVPHPPRTPAAPTNRRAARDQTRPRRGSPLPVPRDQTRQPSHPPAHQRDAPPSRTRRHRHDRALARPREHQDHLRLPARRQPAQTRSDRPHRHDRHPTRPIPPTDSLIAFLEAL